MRWITAGSMESTGARPSIPKVNYSVQTCSLSPKVVHIVLIIFGTWMRWVTAGSSGCSKPGSSTNLGWVNALVGQSNPRAARETHVNDSLIDDG